METKIKDKIIDYAENPRSLDKRFSTNELIKSIKLIINSITDDSFDVKKSYDYLIKIEKNSDELLKNIKLISIINLNFVDSINFYNYKDYKAKPELIEFLAKYLIKRRATYLYMYCLLITKNIEIILIINDLFLKYEKLNNLVSTCNIEKILLELKKTLINAVEKDDYKKVINDIFQKAIDDNQKNDYLNLFKELGIFIQLLLKKSDEFKKLVTNVVPLITKWNDMA